METAIERTFKSSLCEPRENMMYDWKRACGPDSSVLVLRSRLIDAFFFSGSTLFLIKSNKSTKGDSCRNAMRYRPAIGRPRLQVLSVLCKRLNFLSSGRTHSKQPQRVDTSSITKPMPVHHGCDWQVEDTDPVQGWPLSESKKQLSLSKTNVSVTKSTRLRQAKKAFLRISKTPIAASGFRV